MSHISAYEQRALDLATEDYTWLKEMELHLKPLYFDVSPEVASAQARALVMALAERGWLTFHEPGKDREAALAIEEARLRAADPRAWLYPNENDHRALYLIATEAGEKAYFSCGRDPADIPEWPRYVYLVRHTAVELREGVPPHEWLPTPEGMGAARLIAEHPRWLRVGLVATSPEPKAIATAEPIAAAAGHPIRLEPDLREAQRRGTPILDREAYVELVARYLRGEEVAGWEPADHVCERMTRCIDALAGESRAPAVAVSHGLAISLYLGLSGDEWAAIGLPAVATAHVQARRLERQFETP